jgi:DNA-binding MarR family transcriptional regulator
MTRELYISGVLQSRVAEIVRQKGLGSVSEWFVLSHVYHSKPVMAKDIAALLEVEAPLITRLVNKLVKNGLVTTVSDLTDKRVKFIYPTKKSEKLVAEIQKALDGSLKEILKGTTKSDQQAYQKVLTQILINSEKV